MKLFLSSQAISVKQKPYFLALFNKPAGKIKFAHIENAADPYPEEKRRFVLSNREWIDAVGMRVTYVDLRNYKGPDELRKVLSLFDAIWVGGGNTFYLRWIMRQSGFDQTIKNLLKRGIVYGGGSAGAIVVGPTIKNFETADDSKAAPELITDGLHLTQFIPLPHWANEKYGSRMKGIQKQLDADNQKTIQLTDDQALVIEGEEVRLVPE
jgi:dipeptidase E